MIRRNIILAAGAVTASLFAGAATAQEVKLPPSLTITAYDTGTSGFNITVAIGKVMKEKHQSDLRVLPAGNDIARLAPLKAGRAQVSAMGIGGYFAAEGVFEFATKDWGPQPLRLMLSAASCNGITLIVAKDTGVKEFKDLKGKRIGIVVGSPALNQNAYAILAFGGLTTNDVKRVEFSSFGAMWKGMLNNEIDAAVASTITGQVRELEASPRGVVMPQTPASDKAGWARLHKLGPYFYPHKATCGAGGLSATNSLELPAYPYPIFMAYSSEKTDLVYNITKAMIVDYPLYKGAAPGADGLEVKRQILNWVLPYHEGAVKALKEAGAWTAEAQKHNDMLVKRQDTLGKAWADFNKANPPADKDAYAKAWLAARKTALKNAGMDPVF
ncbi:MAG: C4-dicarboxylate ABC transporter [Alphaproteobacteria bacterium RIFCSPHIGHO2_12_FULL_66_14]|jgi:TRAP transporter TAXI family solute receptor|nr:MAG: C4-dicarboxylate ABC transporter [Alphaproteobacteria bacterium RIFCSPHIGHO2_12_FULL_66_14]